MKAPSINLGLGFSGVLGLAAVVGGVAITIYLYSKKSAIIQSVNPLNQDNVFAQGANAVATQVTGKPNTLGGAIADTWPFSLWSGSAQVDALYGANQPHPNPPTSQTINVPSTGDAYL